MKRQLMCFAASALFTTFAAAQTSGIPDPSDPASAPASEDRTSGGTRDTATVTSPGVGTNSSAAKKAKSASTFNAVEAAGGTLNDRDARFVKKAASIGAEEVESGKLAADQAEDAKVKEFAQQMVTDHSQNNDELKSVVEKKGVTLPDGPQGAQATAVAQLKAKKGAEFDRAFVAENVKGHRSAVNLFSRAAKNAKDPEVKSYAEKTLPTLKHHLEMAESLEKSMGGVSGKMSKSKKTEVKPSDTSGGG